MSDYIRRNLDASGDIKVDDFVIDKDVILLAVKSRLQFFKGEWFLNTEDGTPWLQDIFVKPVRSRLVEGILKRRILETPGIESLNSFNLVFDGTTRKLTVDFEAIDQYSNSVTAEVSI